MMPIRKLHFALWKAKRVKLEVSGNLIKGKLRQIAATGVDFLSLGALTHSAPAADITMLTEKI